jgi:hypothetical protein
MRYARIFYSWSKRLKPNGNSRGFIGVAQPLVHRGGGSWVGTTAAELDDAESTA